MLDTEEYCSEEETPERSQTMRTEPKSYKEMTPPSTQNLKALGLWVFFFYMLFNNLIYTQYRS